MTLDFLESIPGEKESFVTTNDGKPPRRLDPESWQALQQAATYFSAISVSLATLAAAIAKFLKEYAEMQKAKAEANRIAIKIKVGTNEVEFAGDKNMSDEVIAKGLSRLVTGDQLHKATVLVITKADRA